ncbi:hypothetical protein ACHAP5_012118 [Fusarium lateritium]
MDRTVTEVKSSAAKLEDVEDATKKAPSPIRCAFSLTMVQRPLDYFSWQGRWLPSRSNLTRPAITLDAWPAWSNSGHMVMDLKSYLHLNDPKSLVNWRRDCQIGAYHNMAGESAANTTAESSQLKIFLQSLSDSGSFDILAKDELVEFLASEIGNKINGFLIRPGSLIDASLFACWIWD